jgi:hypothetical protein
VKRTLATIPILLGWLIPAQGGIMIPDGLGSILKDSTTIVELEVEKFDRDRGIVIWKKKGDLKGKHGADQLQLRLHPSLDHTPPKDLRSWFLDWAQPGRTALLFHNGAGGVMFFGDHFWFSVRPLQGERWEFNLWHCYFGYAYAGSVDELRKHVAAMLEGKEVTVPALDRSWYVYKQLFYMGPDLTRKLPVWRIKAGLKILELPKDEKSPLVVGRGTGQSERVPALVKSLAQAEAKAKTETAAELGRIGPPAQAAVPALTEALKDADGRVRIGAAVALLQIDSKHAAAQTALREALRAQAADVRLEAIRGLLIFDGAVAGTFPALVDAQKDSDAKVKDRATDALSHLLFIQMYGCKATVDDLLVAIQSPDSRCRGQAAYDLHYKNGAEAKRAIPALVRTLTDPELLVRPSAAESLAKIDPENPALLPALVDMLKNEELKAYKNPYVGARTTALFTLVSLGPRAKTAAIPFLIEEVENRRCERCIEVLGDYGPDAKAAVPALLKMMKERVPLPEVAAKALRKIDPESLKVNPK